MTFHCSVKSNIVFSPKSQPRHVRYCTTNPTMPCFPFYSWHLQISVYAKLQLSAETLAIDWLKQNASDVRIVNKSHFRHVSSDTTFPRRQWKLSGEHELVVLRKRWKHATEQRFLKEQINKKKKESCIALPEIILCFNCNAFWDFESRKHFCSLDKLVHWIFIPIRKTTLFLVEESQ